MHAEPSTNRARISALGAHTLGAKVAVYSLGALSSVLIARALGPSGRGRYYLAVTIVTVVYYIATLGTHQAQFRLWAQKKGGGDDFVTTAAFFALVLGPLGVALVWLAFVAGRSTTFAGVATGDIAVAVIALPFMVHSLLIGNLLILKGYLPRTNAALLAGGAIQTAGVVALFLMGELSVQGVLWLYVASVTIPWLIQVQLLPRVGHLKKSIPWEIARSQLKLGAQLTPYVLFGYLNLRIDTFFVARYLDLAMVGIYSVAVIFGELMWLATDSLSSALIERQANAPKAEAVDVTMRGVRMNILIAIGLTALLGIAAGLAITLLFGDDFKRAESVVWILLPAAGAMAIWRPIASALLRFVGAWVQPVIAVAALLVNVIGNVLLIPRFGIEGAAMASILSYGAGALIALVVFNNSTGAGFRRIAPGREELRAITRNLDPRQAMDKDHPEKA